MKTILFQKVAIIFHVAVSCFYGCVSTDTRMTENSDDSFSFAFITDIHIEPGRNAVEGFRQAIDTINKLNPDFVLTGGDLVADALKQSYSRADSLFDLYQKEVQRFTMPVYNTLGNHEIYGIEVKENPDTANPEYGEKMYEKRLGKSYYSYEHKGWKFMVLNSAEDTKKGYYTGLIDSLQIEWIKEELKNTDKETPIIVCTHIPFLSAYKQRYFGSNLAMDKYLVVNNSKDIIELFDEYNLKLVLQGHLHIYEEIRIDGVYYVTGGAICGKWWNGSNYGSEEGFVFLNIKGDKIDWKYIDYGWKVESKNK